MSESLIKRHLPDEATSLWRYALALGGHNVSLSDFRHYVLTNSRTFVGPGELTIISGVLPPHSSFIITAIDVKTRFDLADATLGIGADWRSSFDLNPYGVATSVGVVKLTVDGNDRFPQQTDIGVINGTFLAVILGTQFDINIDPKQPGAKTLVLVIRVNGYLAPSHVGSLLANQQSQLATGTTISL